MRRTAFGVHRNVRIHPEVPLATLPGLVHLGIGLARTVHGRTGHGKYRVIHDSVTLEQRHFRSVTRLDLLEDVLGLIVALDQMAKV